MVFNNLCSNISDMNKGEDLHNYVIFLKLLSCAQNIRTKCSKCSLKFNIQVCAVYALS